MPRLYIKHEQMNKAELRCGNYLYPIHLDGFAAVIEIREQCVIIQQAQGLARSVVEWNNIHRLEPIRVDEKILSKIEEFNIVGDAIRAQLNQYLELCYIIPEEQMRLQTIGSGFTLPIPRLHFLHELQNYWRATTGIELTIRSI